MYKGEYDHELFSTYVSPEKQKQLDAELAESLEIGKEVQRLRRGMDTRFYRLFRVAVRLGRILIGGAMLAVVYELAVGGPLAGLGRMSLGAMSFVSIYALLVWSAIFGALLVIAGKIAFGEPPSDESFLRDARRNVLERQIQKARVAAAYSKSKVWGLLTDPDMGLAGRPVLKSLVVIGGCVVPYLVIALFIIH
jgi:hypothetical protein